MPDYHLYDLWIEERVSEQRLLYQQHGKKFDEVAFKRRYKEYIDYSIGFMTRGCFRKCEFCVNQKYDRVCLHSPLQEFYDPNRKKICLLDDNVLGSGSWENILHTLIDLNKPFKFKQGLDERLLTDDKCKLLFSAKYDGHFTFAFDDVKDYDLIEEKLRLIRKHTSAKNITFYVLCGFKSADAEDIENTWKRIELLMRYQCLPYIMRYQNKNEKPWDASHFRGMYITLARWCNQPNMFKKKSFREFCELNQKLHKSEGYCSAMRALVEFEKHRPDVAKHYFDLRFDNMRGE